jgi:hypothetical protein
MKISDILVESKQLDEGPLLNKIGSAVGKGVGTVAKGIGSVAGGVVGTGKALAKGYQAGKAAVAGGGDIDSNDTISTKSTKNAPVAAAPANAPAAAAPANAPAAAAPAAGVAPTAQQINKAGPAGTPQAKAVTGAVAKQAMAKTGAALAGQDQAQAGQTMYAQVKANVDKLDKKGKQRIMQLLQKSLAAPAAAPAAAAPAAAAPAAVDGAPVKKGARKPARPNQAEIDADRARIMGAGSESAVRTGKVVAESFSLFRKQ